MLDSTNERIESAQQQADKMLAEMSLTEKIGQLSQYGKSIYDDRIDYYYDHYDEGKIGAYLTVHGAKTVNMLQKECKERYPYYIPILFGHDVIHGYKTTFPIPLAQSCSWDPKAAERGAEASAKEAYVSGLKWAFAPMVDIARDPRWGRIAEGYGEDPYLCSRYAEAVVKGYQGEEPGAKYHIMACMKHFAGYGAAIGGKDYNEAEMSLPTLHNVYLEPFKAGIEAGASTVMCGFQSLNGIPCTGNRYLLRNVLRDSWRFDGFVVSDAGSVEQMVDHGFAENDKEACQKALKAGVNMLMSGDNYHKYIPELIREGVLTEEEVDELVRPILIQKILWGILEDPYVDEKEEDTTYFCEEHMNQSREIGRDCIVLLENDGILPLQQGKKLALIGPIADEDRYVLGCWAGVCERNKTVTITEGLKRAGFDVTYEKGCDIEDGTKEELDRAVRLATESDIAVLVLGERHDMSGEARSRADISLPKAQTELLEAVLKTGVPVVLLISAGRPIIVEGFYDRVEALAYVWQLGTAMGDAVADILTGAYDANGRLSVSVPRSVGQIPVYYSHSSTGHPYKGIIPYETRYMDESVWPRYPFGYGLSYTEFQLSDLKLSADSMPDNGSIQISCVIQNTGSRAGKTVVQLYVRDLVGSVVRPVKELKDFEKISLEAGESRTVSFVLPADKLAFYNERAERVIEPGAFHLWIGQNARDEGLFAEFSIR